MSKKVFNPKYEHINIDNYSPFCHINEVSFKYQKKSFNLYFIEKDGKKVPIHPDTFNDLKLDKKMIVFKRKVYPTSSTRTVYDSQNNICYKLPLLRKITRSVRDLPNKELDRSIIGNKLLSQYLFPHFTYLKEECNYMSNPMYNYIVREMPKVRTYPWFYVIKSQKFSKEFELKCMTRIIQSWMFYASHGIYFESAHTQNYLVDDDANIYYRDLSDIRSLDYVETIPSYYDKLDNIGEMLSIFFDRSVCNQNLDHLFRYSKKLNDSDYQHLRKLILSEIDKYQLPFPDYSMDYSKSQKGHIPEKILKVNWR
jgi:hypothetical protein